MAPAKRFGSVRRLSSGRWQARYTHEARESKAPRTFATESEAETWLRIKRTELETGSQLLIRAKRTAGVTLADYSDEWLRERDLKARTRVLYRGQLDLYILPKLGKRSLTSIKPDDVREWFAGFSRDTPTARAHAYALLKSIMAAAMQEDPPLIDSNPCRIRGGSAARRRRTITPATTEELAVILDNMPERLRAMVLLAAWCGLRFGELAELRRVDVEGGVVHVSRAVVRLPGTLEVGTPKSAAGVRTVAMPPHIRPEVETHLDAMEDKRPGALLFPAHHGRHLAASTLNRHWNAAREAAGRPDLRWHDLRHTGATRAAQAGATTADLMARLGHSTIGAAMLYQHAAQDRDAQIAAAMSRMAQT